MEPRRFLSADLAVAASGGQLDQPGGPTGAISGNVYAAELVASCESHRASYPLTGATVQLLDATDAVLEESLTDDQGAYRFSDLTPGQYAVRQATPDGFFDGTAHVGAGGGIALDANHVGEIVVQAGETFSGYDFCDSATAADRVELVEGLAFSFLRLSLQPTATATSETFVEPLLVTPVSTLLTHQAPPLLTHSPAAIFGGSSRSLQPSGSIKAWDDDPIDSWFSIASYWELAAANQTAWDALEPILLGPQASGQTPLNEPGQAADIEAVNAPDDWQREASAKFDRSGVTNAPAPKPLRVTAALQPNPQVARRQDTPAAETLLPAAPGQLERIPATS